MTSTAETEDALTSACSTIRHLWPIMHQPQTGSIAGKPTPKALHTRPDHDESDADIARLDVIVSLRAEVTATLNGWARVIVDDRELSHGLPLGTDAVGLCVLIERHAQWLSGHEAAPDAVEEITSAARRVRAVANPQRREWMPIGTCPLEVVEEVLGRVVGTCGGQVRAYPGRDPQCQKCGTVAVASWWERIMFPDAELSELVTADELVLVLHRAFGGSPVKPSTIRQWIKRGVIAASGQKDDKGRSLYDRGAVVYAVARKTEVST